MKYNVGDIVEMKVTTDRMAAGTKYKVVHSDGELCRLHTLEGKPVPGSCTPGWLDKCATIASRA